MEAAGTREPKVGQAGEESRSSLADKFVILGFIGTEAESHQRASAEWFLWQVF